MLVSATLTDEVLQQFRPHCPNLVPVFVGQQHSHLATTTPSAVGHAVDETDSAAAGQPRWGWGEASGASQALWPHGEAASQRDIGTALHTAGVSRPTLMQSM